MNDLHALMWNEYSYGSFTLKMSLSWVHPMTSYFLSFLPCHCLIITHFFKCTNAHMHRSQHTHTHTLDCPIQTVQKPNESYSSSLLLTTNQCNQCTSWMTARIQWLPFRLRPVSLHYRGFRKRIVVLSLWDCVIGCVCACEYKCTQKHLCPCRLGCSCCSACQNNICIC